MRGWGWPAVCAVLAFAPACGGDDDGETGDATASGTFAGVNGQTVEGTAVFTLSGGAVSLTVDITSAAEGDHGMHIHEIPSCGNEGSDAGAHWDPVDNDPSLHDLPPNGHLGDLGNIAISSGGTGTVVTQKAAWALGDASDNDVASHAIIFHEMTDDGTMPSAGARHGCAVVILD